MCIDKDVMPVQRQRGSLWLSLIALIVMSAVAILLFAPAALAGMDSSPPRQTTFDEHNYKPRTDINTLPSPPRRRNAPDVSARKSRPLKTTDHTASWNWVTANRKRIPVQIGWKARDGWIDYGSVCHNERRGSTEYRRCRQAAKDYFVHRCRKDRLIIFCHAENNYSPL